MDTLAAEKRGLMQRQNAAHSLGIKQLYSNEFTNMNRTMMNDSSRKNVDSGQSPNITAYAMAHPDPVNNAANPGMTRELYDSALKNKSFARFQRSDPRLVSPN